MNDADDRDDFEELLLLEDILISEEEREKEEGNEGRTLDVPLPLSPLQVFLPENNAEEIGGEDSSSGEEQDPEISEEDVAAYRETLSLNEKLIRCLLDYKRHINVILKKCDRKLELIEAKLNGNSISSSKLLICNAGHPYFKDKVFFCAASNEDELTKESRGELQVDNLSKVFGWTSRERNTLFKAIREEVVGNALARIDDEDEDEPSGKGTKEDELLQKNFREMCGPLGEREFDWFKIAVMHFQEKHSPSDCRAIWNVFLHPEISKTRWKKSEDSRLKEIAENHHYQDWDSIARELDTRRSGYQCFVRYNTTKKVPKARNCVWTAEEDDLLVRLVEVFKIGDYVPWGDVAGWMQNRTKQQVYFRWIYSLAPYLVKGRFTKNEDSALKEAVSKFGKNFCKISAALMPNRSTVQLSVHYARMAVEKKDRAVWTLNDDVELLELHERYGQDWSTIAKTLGTRTRTQVRHRYTAIQRNPARVQALATLRSEVIPINDNDADAKNEVPDGVRQPVSVPREYDLTDRVDFQLLEFFRNERARAAKPPARNCERPENSSDEEIASLTKDVYNLLRTLNATVRIPEDISNGTSSTAVLDEREKRLYSSIRDYMKEKSDPEKNKEIMERCSVKMFGPGGEEQGESSRFVPPLAFDTYVRTRKVKRKDTIDCPINGVRTYLIDAPMEFETPDIVVSSVGGEEEDARFEKLSKLLENNRDKGGIKPGTEITGSLFRKIYVLSPQVLNRQIGNRLRQLDSQNIILVNRSAARSRRSQEDTSRPLPSQNLLMEDLSHRPSIPYLDVPVEERRIPCLEPSYETLLGFKKLKYFKNVMDRIDSLDRETAIGAPESQIPKSDACQQVYNLLETRLEQLFKYPLALSKSTLPELYGSDTLFSAEPEGGKRRRVDRLTDTPAKRQKQVTEVSCQSAGSEKQ